METCLAPYIEDGKDDEFARADARRTQPVRSVHKRCPNRRLVLLRPLQQLEFELTHAVGCTADAPRVQINLHGTGVCIRVSQEWRYATAADIVTCEYQAVTTVFSPVARYTQRRM